MRQDGFHCQETMTTELCGSNYSWVKEKNSGKTGVGTTVWYISCSPKFHAKI